MSLELIWNNKNKMPKYKSLSNETLIRGNYNQQEPPKKKNKTLDEFKDEKEVEKDE